MSASLPSLDPIIQAHSDRVKAHIVEQIAQAGPLSFASYMELALYAVGLGYYRAGLQKFGDAGDFITAPELSPLFSHCVARQCATVLSHLGGGDILEIGAGSGRMALEILRELSRQNQLPRRYFILELCGELRDRQKALFEKEAPEFLNRVEWLSHWPENPINGVILANEVLDAMPVHKFKIAEGVQEIGVDYQDGQFHWCVKDTNNKALKQRVEALDIDFFEGYESEINLMLKPWLGSVSDSLAQGLVLLIDYGFPRHEYYHPERSRGTVMCHVQHVAHDDPLVFPGVQDITSHVDFTAVAEAAIEHDFSVSGFTNQAAFLMNCGIGEAASNPDDTWRHLKNIQQMKQLTHPGEMGELFKVIALTKDYDEPLLGFALFDQRARL